MTRGCQVLDGIVSLGYAGFTEHVLDREPMMLRTALAIVLSLCSISHAQSFREAVREGNVDRVRELLERGVDANTSYENRLTPIYFASDPRIVDLLIAHGARLNIRDAALIQSPIEHAAERHDRDKEHRENWKIIVSKLRDAGAEYTIDTATYMNDVKFIRSELEKDSSWANQKRGAQSVPLRVAARRGRVEICKLLLDHNADPDSFGEGNGYPILVDAIDHPKVVALLIERGANLRRRITWQGGRTGYWIIGDASTALHFAVRAGNDESVKLLLEAGLDPNATDVEGQTPLHLAVRFENFKSDHGEQGTTSYMKIIEHLIKNDASVDFTNRKRKTPLDLAKKLKSPPEILRALKSE